MMITVAIDYDKVPEARAWCLENIFAPPDVWYQGVFTRSDGKIEFHFVKSEDATMFALRFK